MLCKHSLSAALALLLTCTAAVTPVCAEETAPSAELSPQSALEEDLALVWGKNREVKVVQRREFIKDGRFDVSLFGGMIPNDDFLIYYTTGLRFGYHFTESFMVEVSGAEAFDQDTKLASFLVDSIKIKSAEIRERIQRFATVNILWSPIYGKLSFLGNKLTHFDTFIGLGVGVFQKLQRENDENPNPITAYEPSGNTIVGFRWHLTDMINLRTEYRHYFYRKVANIGGISKPAELSLSVGFSF
jgi:outer membrane beta-barrel protein